MQDCVTVARCTWRSCRAPITPRSCSMQVGKGKRAYHRIQAALRRWDHMRLGWTETVAPPAAEGTLACVVAHVQVAWLRNPLQVTHVSEHNGSMTHQPPGQQPQHVKGRLCLIRRICRASISIQKHAGSLRCAGSSYQEGQSLHRVCAQLHGALNAVRCQQHRDKHCCACT